ncbi:aryl-phospho-beta-D-glucosidase BglC (GH1 family) [Rhizobium cellulosilyticum]|nr:glycoside hydrolase family 5 protein [Rhizobium cellulosilyticum]MBB4413648.1 aryl-phospho-beta-D-glucosidase BglC (GH1 family) [Rhizobium cellulosilyticum]
MDLGINLWGADWVFDGTYMVPTTSQIDYFASKGFTNIRLPFNWETMQSSLDGPLNADLLKSIHQVVDYAASQGISVILDVHNYGRYNDQLIGSPEVPVSSFVDLWSKIASEFADDSNVRFGLMNEPQQENASDWLSISNAAIAAIRETGATQQVLVPGIGWTGAWSWTSGDNAKIIGAEGAIVDPANNYAIEVHQYLDDTSGQHEWVVSADIGVERLTAITEWARANGVSLYLGEFGVADNPQALEALDKMMAYLQANDDVWTSASYWVAGMANPTYIYTVQPDLGVLDVPQMDVLEKYTGAVVTETVLKDGTVRHDVYAQDGKTVTLSDVLTKNGELLSRSIFDADGNLSSKAVIAVDGGITVTVYGEAGKAYPATETVYNSDHEHIQESVTDAAGITIEKLYEPGAHEAYQETSYHADGSLNYVTEHIDGKHISETYENGVLTKIEVYNSSWTLVSRDSFDASGNLTGRQVDNADGSHDLSTFNAKTGIIQSVTEYAANWTVSGTTSYDSKGYPTRQVSYEADGSRTITSYKSGSDALSQSQHLTAEGKLASLTTYSEAGQTTSTYAPPGSALVDSTVVIENGVVVSSVQYAYDAKGLITTVEHVEADGSRTIENYDDTHQTNPVSTTAYDASWKLISVTYFDENGRVSVINAAGDNGVNTLTSFVAGTNAVSQVEVYVDWKLQSRTNYDENGSISKIQTDHGQGTHEVQTFTPEQQDHPTSTTLYDASWKLVSVSYFDELGHTTVVNVAGENGLNTLTSFVPGTDDIKQVEVYVDWKLQSRTDYDADGKISKIQTDNDDGTHEVQVFTAEQQGHPSSTSLYDASWKLVAYTTFDSHSNDGAGSMSFLVAGDSVDAAYFESAAAGDETSPHTYAFALDDQAGANFGDETFSFAEAGYADEVFSTANHIFNAFDDTTVVSPHYDLV